MKIDRSGAQGKTLKERAVSHHDGSNKPQSRLRAIPSNEFFDGVFIAPTGMCRRQHVEHSHLRLVEFWHGETRTTGRLAWLFFGRHRRWLLPPPTNLACKQIPARDPRNSKPILLGRKNRRFW